MFRARLTTILLLATLVIAPMGLGQGAVPNPVVNPGFELHHPDAAGEHLEGTPADECVGIGHQVFYGTETWQHKLVDEQDPVGAGSQLASDPAGEALFLSGYGHCVWSEEDGQDVVTRSSPVSLAQDDAVHWVGDNVVVDDHDEDGDREALVPSGGEDHNLWQAWASPFQAFTANFDALEFDVEEGSIADNAKVIISMSSTPLEGLSPWVPLYLDCQISFGAELLRSSMDEEGHVAAAPTDAGFTSRFVDCEEAADAWQQADEEGDEEAKREILGRMRIVQLSFWGFEQAPEDPACGCAVQIDDVALSHATTVAEEVASGNANPELAPSVEDELE